ncbi:hypothetical protein ACUODJ_58665, partial [Escherichia sp. HC-CC]
MLYWNKEGQEQSNEHAVSFLRVWLPEVEQPEIRKAEIKNDVTMNLFISSRIITFYICCGVKLISPYKNNSVCIFL